MLLLNAELVDGDVRLSLGIRRPHPSMWGWAQAFSLMEITQVAGLTLPPQSSGTLTIADGLIHVTELGQGQTISIGGGRAVWKLGGREQKVVEGLVAARHEVTLDLTSRKADPYPSHTLSLLDSSGGAHILEMRHYAPAIASAFQQSAGLPVTFVVNAIHDRGTGPVSAEGTALLSSFFAMSTAERGAIETTLRQERSADSRDDDDAAYLVDKLGVALSHLAGVVERRQSAVEAMVTHVLGTAKLSVTLAQQPTLVTLTATLPTLRAAPSVSFSRASGIGDAIRNRRDVQCGVADVDDAFIIRGHAEAAAAIADAAGHRLLSLGAGTTLTLDADELSVAVVCTDPHPGCHAAIARQMAFLWEALLTSR